MLLRLPGGVILVANVDARHLQFRVNFADPLEVAAARLVVLFICVHVIDALIAELLFLHWLRLGSLRPLLLTKFVNRLEQKDLKPADLEIEPGHFRFMYFVRDVLLPAQPVELVFQSAVFVSKLRVAAF